MSPTDKPLAWRQGELKTPPMSEAARREAGYLLRRLQRGDLLGMPESRPMPAIGARVHELRIDDGETRNTWRVVYRIDPDAIVVLELFSKKTQKTPKSVMDTCRKRLRAYDAA